MTPHNYPPPDDGPERDENFVINGHEIPIHGEEDGPDDDFIVAELDERGENFVMNGREIPIDRDFIVMEGNEIIGHETDGIFIPIDEVRRAGGDDAEAPAAEADRDGEEGRGRGGGGEGEEGEAGEGGARSNAGNLENGVTDDIFGIGIEDDRNEDGNGDENGHILRRGAGAAAERVLEELQRIMFLYI